MRAAVSDAPDGSIGNLELTGVIVTPGLRMALLRDKDGKNQVRLREGAALPGDRWTLREVASRGVTIERDGERRRLTMKTAAPVRMANAPAAVPPNTPVRAALPQPATTAVPPTDPGVR
ncbi:type II secretion system (T2SS) protein C [Luteibacter rhizovicinus]|uniref:Type II secretion system (T2SS) protein C n=2 Tax=Luteibacter rhizovicinus TaxID=242606 RepID=A0A4R3YEV5_9GAMM|nr:type II secretion system (T2SS) protein C [Luteibacter rhizovicinus]